ncbi:MAG TPA: metal ABC transporter permease [Tepidisphaeraceae bacterium]|nr:metal ABC transporter permease [Tepidisphaeraceae bacterium]
MSISANTLLTASALAIACALLSLFVVLCRWAFIGEGIGHSGFGGAGTAWILALLFPALDQPWIPYACVIVFCLLTACAIAMITRKGEVNSDAAIGIFMVASLAWGFLAQQIYIQVRHTSPSLFSDLLFGQIASFSPDHARAVIIVCLGVILVVILLWKQFIAYSFDPMLAASSGVPARFIHYLLILLLAMVIVVSMRLAGSVLVTALLVLPAATALRISQRLDVVLTISIATAFAGAICGVLLNHRWPFLPPGPMIVLLMFVEFLVAWVIGAFQQASWEGRG